MLILRILALAVICTAFVSCESAHAPKSSASSLVSCASQRKGDINGVKTTAYTHTERDHLKYKVATAAGGTLKYGEVRSAAADWSVYPVGTQFKIAGDTHVYEIDDYGSALVGTGTIDLYKPSKAAMRTYGAKNVNIKVLKWGSIPLSLAILKPREGKAPHIQKMIKEIQHSAAG